MKLDRSKPFGTVYGPANHAFEQDGRLFDQAGNEVGAEPDDLAAPVAKNKGGRPKKVDENPQLEAQLNG